MPKSIKEHVIGAVKLPFAALANATLGTWHLPLGLDLPDVDAHPATLALHKGLTRTADFPPLARTRIGVMKIFETAARRYDKPSVQNILFYDDTGKAHTTPTRSIFFPGSGIDCNRNVDTGIRDIQIFMRAMLGQKSPELENGPIAQHIRAAGLEETTTYLYHSQSTSRMLSSAWFNRLEHAYRLNIQPDFISDEAREFSRANFLPLVSRTDETGTRHKIDVAEAAENMRFTLSGQSYGGTFIQMTINALYEDMKNLKYTDDEIQKVFDNILVFNISGATFASDKLNRPTPKTIFIEHELDFVGFQTDRHDTHPYFQGPADKRGIALSDRRHFFWLDYKWQSPLSPNGIVKPKHDVYGFHDHRGTLSAIPPEVRNALAVSLNPQTKSLPPLQELMAGTPPHTNPTPAL